MQTYAGSISANFAYDVYGINNGYPVLAWQNERVELKLNKNQEYIKINETLQLEVFEDSEISKIIEKKFSNDNFEWISTNEDVATVDQNGLVTGHTDRIYYNLCI